MSEFGEIRVAWLEAFVAVVANQKQVAAAKALDVDQATISRHVRQLEAWLGKLLVDTSGPGRSLYPDGEKFLPVAEEVLRLLRTARAVFPPSPPAPEPKPSAKGLRVPALVQTPKGG